ncbi:MAG: hypothetical protein WCG36_10820, partial [bacterium]
RFRVWCVDKARMPAANVTVLSGDAGAKRDAAASAGDVIKAIDRVADRATPADQFILFMAGHGDKANDGEASVFMPGPDLTASALKSALARVRTENQVVLNFGAASGDMIALLAATNRVVVTATAPGELADPVFAEFFLLALERSQGTNTVAVLDQFNRATHETALWIRRILKTDAGWHVEGKESIRLFRKLAEGPSGAPVAFKAEDGTVKLISTSGRQLDPGSLAWDEEPSPSLANPLALGDAQAAGLPVGVRAITEHAMLADCGLPAGVAAVVKDGFVPIAGATEGAAGYRAARVCLGKP